MVRSASPNPVLFKTSIIQYYKYGNKGPWRLCSRWRVFNTLIVALAWNWPCGLRCAATAVDVGREAAPGHTAK